MRPITGAAVQIQQTGYCGLPDRGIAALRSGLELRARLCHPPHRRQRIRQIEPRLRQLRRQTNHRFEFRHSLRIRLHEGEHDAVTVARLHVVRIVRDRLFEMVSRLGVRLPPRQQIAEVVVRLGQIRLRADGFA